jgi:signal transduction histidine kinase
VRVSRGASLSGPASLSRGVALASLLGAAVLVSEADAWRPATLVVALGVAMVAGEFATVPARRIRLSAGLMVQTTIMALLGPAPAAVIGVLAIAVESRVNRVDPRLALNNALVFAILGVVGGLLFETLRSAFGLDRDDTAYALLVLPAYVLLSVLNLLLVSLNHARDARTRVILDTGLPTAPLEVVNGMLAMAAVLVWAHAGLAAAAALVLVLAVTMPLARTLADALRSSDDLRILREVSDERAAEVARLASDRDRLLSEVMDAERRERTRLAESLHDGPMQRFMVARQDAAESDPALTCQLDEAIAETRALISAFHPATVRELGFEASLRAAIAPFLAARSVRLTVQTSVDDRALADTLLLPVAQELVVNAIKHADPTAIDVVVDAIERELVLEINDDGVGIDSERADRAVQAGHLGLAMVRRRVEDAGGQLEIATRPDGGTRSRVVLPLASSVPSRRQR